MASGSGRGKEPADPVPEPTGVADALQAAIAGIDTDTILKDKLAGIRAYYDESYRRPVTHGEPAVGELNQDGMKALLLTEANGDYELPVQTVTVEYLRIDQKLVLPAPLAFSLIENVESESRVSGILYQRYFRVLGLSYAAVKALVTKSKTATELCEAIDAKPIAAGIQRADMWLKKFDLGLPVDSREPKAHINLVFATLSHALQFNCDIRDVGALTEIDMRAEDNDWTKIANVPKDRLRSKLKPLTLQSIAALNMAAVARFSLSAWVRAFAVSSGVLPSVRSRAQVEYAFTYDQPPKDATKDVIAYQNGVSFNLHSVCLNVVAMFGLLHLAKDHTYKSNDVNMERICTSWIMTLRTIVDVANIDLMKENMESICRTAVHPFGLGQTYWVAKLMASHNLLASPLAIRADVSPPNVQRVMIIRAATEEWAGLASGQMLNKLFAEYLADINEEYEHILASPPAYSHLWRLYGVEKTFGITNETQAACSSMMPIVYGYSMAMHVDEDKRRDGLALALSFANVARDNRVLAKTLEAVWGRYLDDVSKTGLLDFVAQSAKAMGIEMARGT